MLRHLDLFSGIGGFALGFRWAGGFETVAFAECEPFCQQVLEKHWSGVRCYDDIGALRGLSLSDIERGRETNGRSEPCLRPDWLVIENGFHRWRAWVPELRRKLYSRGYASVPLRVCASDVGCRHRRARVFLVANADGEQLRQLTWWWHGPGRALAQELNQHRDYSPGAVGADDGLSNGLDQARRKALGNAIVPQIAEIIGRAILAVEAENAPERPHNGRDGVLGLDP